MLLDTWHKRVGAVLLLLREQEKGWDRMTAAQESHVDAKTIKRIERGSERVTGAKLAEYARVFGLTIETLSERARHLEGSTPPAEQSRQPRGPTSAELAEWGLQWLLQQPAEIQKIVRDGMPTEIQRRLEPQPSPGATTRRRRSGRGAR